MRSCVPYHNALSKEKPEWELFCMTRSEQTTMKSKRTGGDHHQDQDAKPTTQTPSLSSTTRTPPLPASPAHEHHGHHSPVNIHTAKAATHGWVETRPLPQKHKVKKPVTKKKKTTKVLPDAWFGNRRVIVTRSQSSSSSNKSHRK